MMIMMMMMITIIIIIIIIIIITIIIIIIFRIFPKFFKTARREVVSAQNWFRFIETASRILFQVRNNSKIA